MKILHLTLKKKWFDMISSGEKKEEYREVKGYWIQRLVWEVGTREDFTHVLFRNGYTKDAPRLTVEYKGCKVGYGLPNWGAKPYKQYFVISLGEILNEEQKVQECDANEVE